MEEIEAMPELIRQVRVARGLSQREVARQTGVAFSTVSRIERGHDCTVSHLLALFRWAVTPVPLPTAAQLLARED